MTLLKMILLSGGFAVAATCSVQAGGLSGSSIEVQSWPPKGYRSVWNDGRFNPYRGERAAYGREQQRRIWTDRPPMKLVDPAYAVPGAVIRPVPD